jgi:hypothetical protein
MTILRYNFVDNIPENLLEGEIYISIKFATAIHKCCCGCGHEVVTPLSPTDWKLIFDGVSISLHPSIGNWDFDCRSHYWIKKNRVRWASNMTNDEIKQIKNWDKHAKDAYLNGVEKKLDVPRGKKNTKPKKQKFSLRSLTDLLLK